MENTLDKPVAKNNMKERLQSVGQVATAAMNAELLKKKVDNAVETVVYDAERLAKRGKHAIEDAIDDATYHIKKQPWSSVGYVFGAGLGIGVVTGWLLTRRNGNRMH